MHWFPRKAFMCYIHNMFMYIPIHRDVSMWIHKKKHVIYIIQPYAYLFYKEEKKGMVSITHIHDTYLKTNCFCTTHYFTVMYLYVFLWTRFLVPSVGLFFLHRRYSEMFIYVLVILFGLQVFIDIFTTFSIFLIFDIGILAVLLCWQD